LVGVEEGGGAKAFGAEEGLDAGEGVGKLVGVAERTEEEVVLSGGGQGGGEFQHIRNNRGGRGEGVEVGVEWAEQVCGLAAGFGEADLTLVLRVIVEGKAEVNHEGGPLHGGKAGAEGVEGAAEEKEKGFERLEGMLEFVADPELRFGAVEIEEALMLAVKNVVQARDLGAEPLAEALAGKGREVTEGAEPPEAEEVEVGRRKPECGMGK
jgi:hypothetical protein